MEYNTSYCPGVKSCNGLHIPVNRLVQKNFIKNLFWNGYFVRLFIGSFYFSHRSHKIFVFVKAFFFLKDKFCFKERFFSAVKLHHGDKQILRKIAKVLFTHKDILDKLNPNIKFDDYEFLEEKAKEIENSDLEMGLSYRCRSTSPELSSTTPQGWFPCIWTGISYPIKVFWKYFIDGNHPWKQKKYKFFFESLKDYNNDFSTILEIKPSEKEKIGLEEQFHTLVNDFVLDEQCNFKDYRLQYHNFLMKLRKLLKNNEFQDRRSLLMNGGEDHLVKKILELCFSIYSKVYLYTFAECIVHDFIILGFQSDENNLTLDNMDLDEISLEDQARAIDRVSYNYKGNKATKLKNNAAGATGICFDPNYRGNIPYVNFEYFLEGKPVQVLRFATPTIEGIIPTNPAVVNREFENFILYSKLIKKKLLYITLQDKNHGSEAKRTMAILEFSKREQIADTFVVVTFDYDSDFYNQEGPFNSLSESYSDFKNKFIENLLSSNSGYYFPDEMKNDQNFVNELGRLMDHVHEDFFFKAQNLSKTERENFIQVYYIPLSIYLQKYVNADMVNIGCKDNIDRGGGLNSLLYKFIQILRGIVFDRISNREQRTLTHFGALQAKKQGIIKDRCKRINPAQELLSTPEIRINIFQRRNDYGIDPSEELIIKKNPSQKTYLIKRDDELSDSSFVLL